MLKLRHGEGRRKGVRKIMNEGENESWRRRKRKRKGSSIHKTYTIYHKEKKKEEEKKEEEEA